MAHLPLQLLIERSLRELGYEIVGDDEDGWSYTFGSFESSRNIGRLDSHDEAVAAAFRDAVGGLQAVITAGTAVVDHWESSRLAEFVRELDASVKSMTTPRWLDIDEVQCDPTHVARVQTVNRFAQFEGWGIFNDKEIQRDDEMDRFESDDDALAHVRQLANAGSRLHREALALLRLPR
jgi:hypothetical protein